MSKHDVCLGSALHFHLFDLKSDYQQNYLKVITQELWSINHLKTICDKTVFVFISSHV